MYAILGFFNSFSKFQKSLIFSQNRKTFDKTLVLRARTYFSCEPNSAGGCVKFDPFNNIFCDSLLGTYFLRFLSAKHWPSCKVV